LTFLVVSCPCALVISIPLTFFAGIGGASHKGILIKGGNYMDALTKLSTVVFDKTGTLTKGTFEVEAIHPEKLSEQELLHLAAHVERFSTHPIAIALRTAYAKEKDNCSVDNIQETAGQGITATVNGKKVSVGNARLMTALGMEIPVCKRCVSHIGTMVHVAVDGEYAGHIIISDQLKADAVEAIEQLKALGVRKTVMLTGDKREVAEQVAEQTKVTEYYAELLPADKVSHVERLIVEKRGNETIAFVGDGINDAPVLARADVGIAMGALGSDAAIEAADVVLMDDKPSKIALAIELSRRTIFIAKENAWFAIGIKVAVLLLATFGMASMGLAVFADVGVMVLAVLNAMRAR
jgi:cadmium-exporting ATPase